MPKKQTSAQNQAPPEFESIVVGCNTWNCKSKISNANWETKTIEQISINQGDSINVKASFIDTRGSASGNIEVPEDTVISLEHYFYWVHTFNACGGGELISAQTDGSGNLRQQVLVGPDLQDFYNGSQVCGFFTDAPGTNTNGYGTFGRNDADGLPYIVYVSRPTDVYPGLNNVSEPLKKRWSMTLKKGSYDPNYIAELITRSMSRQKTKRVYNVLQSNQKPTTATSTLNVPTDNTYNSFVPLDSNVWANEGSNTAQNTFYDSKNPQVYGGTQSTLPTEYDYNLPPDNSDDMPFLFTPSVHSQPLTTNGATNEVWCSIPHWHANGLNDLGNYNENNPGTPGQLNITLHPLISDVRSMSPTVALTAPGVPGSLAYYTMLPFYSQNNSGANGTNGGLFPVTFGATQMSLTYNNEGNQLFSFSYMHSPILAFLDNQSTAVTECTAHMYTTSQQAGNLTSQYYTTQIDKKSGILLHKMEPRGFWEQLGFDVDAITTDFTNKERAFQMTYNEFDAKTTGGFSGSSNIFNPIFKTIGSADQPSVADTEIVYLQCAPNSEIGPIVSAVSPNLIVGRQYKITFLGLVNTVNPMGNVEPNEIWAPVGGLVPASVGEIFTATTNGFPFPYFTYEGVNYNWSTDFGEEGSWVPYVEILGQPGATTTQIQNLYFEVESTNSLDAVRIPEQRDSAGHILIEITAYPSIYLDDNAKREIKSIVSNYYVSEGSFISGSFSDSYSYFHVGESMTISNIKIRILDPVTMLELSNLGPNSSVYLQLNKLLSNQEIAQVEN